MKIYRKNYQISFRLKIKMFNLNLKQHTVAIENILSLSIVFTIFTQLRILNLPVGLGEITLMLLGIAVFVDSCSYKMIKNLLSNIFVRFWLISFLLLTVGFLYSKNIGLDIKLHYVIYDYLAYGFVFFVILLLVALNDYYEINIDKITKNIVIYSIIFYMILLIIPVAFYDSVGLMKYFHGNNNGRFVGLSLNPNQLALFFSPVIFFIFHFLKKEKYLPILYVLLFVLCFLLILCICSTALWLSWIIGIGMIAIYCLYSKLDIYNKKKFLILSILFLTVCFIFLYFYTYEIMYLIKDSEQVDGRLSLIKKALNNFCQSPFFGLGPGPHSFKEDITYAWEAHNTIVDLMTQVGIAGLSAYLYLIFHIGRNLIYSKKIYLFVALVALFVFSLFHFVLRHPIFWFYLYYLYNEGREKKCAE